jgi:hypothetical protein
MVIAPLVPVRTVPWTGVEKAAIISAPIFGVAFAIFIVVMVCHVYNIIYIHNNEKTSKIQI